jgi:CheY-like chemotaxis protein
MPYLYQLETFSNPLEAALFIGDKKPDLVLMDLLMPGLDGFSLAERIKQTSPDSRIIVITAYATEQNMKRLKKYNIDGLLTKPIDLKTLKRMIEDILEIK